MGSLAVSMCSDAQVTIGHRIWTVTELGNHRVGYIGIENRLCLLNESPHRLISLASSAIPGDTICIIDGHRDESALEHRQHRILSGKCGRVGRSSGPFDPYVERTSFGRTGVRADGLESPPFSIASVVIDAFSVAVASRDKFADIRIVFAESGEAEERVGMDEMHKRCG